MEAGEEGKGNTKLPGCLLRLWCKMFWWTSLL